jgi:hypothetical protein
MKIAIRAPYFKAVIGTELMHAEAGSGKHDQLLLSRANPKPVVIAGMIR